MENELKNKNEMAPGPKIRWIGECKKVLENEYRSTREPYFEAVFKMSSELLGEYQNLLLKDLNNIAELQAFNK